MWVLSASAEWPKHTNNKVVVFKFMALTHRFKSTENEITGDLKTDPYMNTYHLREIVVWINMDIDKLFSTLSKL